jgi:hypothetical protein
MLASLFLSGACARTTCAVRTRLGLVATLRSCLPAHTRPTRLLGEHLGSQHPGTRLTSSQLTHLQTLYCQSCGQLKSTTRRGHRCSGRQQQQASPVAPPVDPPQACCSHVRQQQQPAAQVAPQVVSFVTREIWAEVLTSHVQAFLTAAETKPAHVAAAAFDDLLRLPSRVLDGRSNGAARRAIVRMQRAQQGLPLWEEQAEDGAVSQDDGSRRGNIPDAHRKAARIHCCLQLGSVSKAAKCLDAAPLADPSDEVLAALRPLHPEEESPTIPECTAPPLLIVEETLRQVLKETPQGSTAGPSGWTYEHIKAATSVSEAAFYAVLDMVCAVASGAIPHLPSLLQATLIPVKKATGGVRPIAVGEVWYRLAAPCALAACRVHGLAPLQLGVGIRGGSQNVGHALRAGVVADPGCVTVEVDVANAFNEVRRHCMIDTVAQRAPQLLPMVA